MYRNMQLLFVGVVFAVLVGYQSADAASAGPNVVNVTAREYMFEMPDSIPAGPTMFHFTDEGNELHHMTLVKLEQGKTLADFKALPPGPMPSWAVFVGGPNSPMPHGGQDDDVIDLAPGNYAVICLIPDSTGKPHMMNGMINALTVTPSTEVHTMPSSDLTLSLQDYQFSFSMPVTAGKHVISVINNGPQMHEAEIFSLQPGKTGEDIAMWVDGGLQGPPPGAPVAGISAEGNHHENVLMVDFKPGNYAVLCFMPDAKDGKLHAMHGMIYNFNVM